MMKKLLIAVLLCAALMVTMIPAAFAASDENYTTCMNLINEQRTVQAQAHQTAQQLRQLGYSESSYYIQSAKSTWHEAQDLIVGYQKLAQFTDEDIRILATAVYYEAGNTTEQLRGYVAQVILNRVADSRFPNTVKEVINQRGQYSTRYSTLEATQAIQKKDAQNGTYTYLTCESTAKAAIMGQVDMPSNVIYQANFTQGKGVWKSVYYDSGWYSSTSYFCYG